MTFGAQRAQSLQKQIKSKFDDYIELSVYWN